MLDQDVRPAARHAWRQGPPWVAAGGVLVLGCVAAYSLGLAQRPAVPDGPVSVPAASSDVPTATGAGELATIGNGTHIVGRDVKPGRYETTGVDASSGLVCVWERQRDLSGEVSGVIAQNLGTGPDTVEILASDVAFKSSGCAPWTEVP